MMGVGYIVIEAFGVLVELIVFGAALFASMRASFAPGPWRVLLPVATALTALMRVVQLGVSKIVPDAQLIYTAGMYVFLAAEIALVVGLFLIPARGEGSK